MKKTLLHAIMGASFICHSIDSNAQIGNTHYGIQALLYNTTGDYNTAIGYDAMWANTTGSGNTANGYKALYLNKTGFYNTATGANSLFNNQGGYNNTSNGYSSLYKNTKGSYNTAMGYASLYNNISGSYNTAAGSQSLYNNTEGSYNTAFGDGSLYYNTTGSYNTAFGKSSLFLNSTGQYNTAIGRYSLNKNTTGYKNTASGHTSLYSNTTGQYNTADGYLSLYWNTTGSFNTSIGSNTLYSNKIGSRNTALGYYADVSTDNLSNATAIGYGAKVDASNKVRIGNTSVTSIGGQVAWTTFSDGRYKKNIKENVPGLAFINSLRPVTYTVDIRGLNEHYNKGRKQDSSDEAANDENNAAIAEMKNAEDAASKIVYNGFVAQEVEEAARKLNFEFSGVDKPQSKDALYGLRYENFIVPLVKAVQQLSQMNEELKKQNEIQQKQLDELNATIGGNTKTNVTLNNVFLEQNIPNPFNKSSIIKYSLPKTFSNAQLVVTDKNGKTVKQIKVSGSGKGTLNIDATTLSAGTYNYSLIVDGRAISSKQMVLTK
jgi:hypothetical protein